MTSKSNTDSKAGEEREERGDEEEVGAHLDGIADGCGCTEVWEHLSEHREG